MTMGIWHLYVIRTKQRSLYTGISTDIDRRIAEHRQGSNKGSKYLRSKGPLALVYRTPIGNRTQALRAEQAFKRLSKLRKERIVSEQPDNKRLFGILGLPWSS